LRLVSYRANGAFRAGILHDDHVVDAGPSVRDLLELEADQLRELAVSGDPVDAGMTVAWLRPPNALPMAGARASTARPSRTAPPAT
jgi:hypothetical protein